jgi:ribonuclease-3
MKIWMKKNVDEKIWMKKWGISVPSDILKTALTHPTYHNIDLTEPDYDRLEFLGDAALSLIVAEFVFKDENVLSEGQMTRNRAKLVNNEYLASVFDELSVQHLIRTTKNYNLSVKDRANFFEAILGAIFLAEGFKKCRRFWFKLHKKMNPSMKKPDIKIEREIDPVQQKVKESLSAIYEELGLIPKNPISSIQELCNKNGMPIPQYHELMREGPPHDPIFVFEIEVTPFPGEYPKVYSANGKGSSKKKAKMSAAANLCDQIYLKYFND